MARPAWMGAAFALVIAFSLAVLGGGAPKPSAPAAPAEVSQPPAPTLDPLIKDSSMQPSASPEAPSQATSSHKESK